jgi:hypothetical protein
MLLVGIIHGGHRLHHHMHRTPPEMLFEEVSYSQHMDEQTATFVYQGTASIGIQARDSLTGWTTPEQHEVDLSKLQGPAPHVVLCNCGDVFQKD